MVGVFDSEMVRKLEGERVRRECKRIEGDKVRVRW